MEYNNSTDKRLFARIPTELPIRLLASGQEEECSARTVDISANGIGLVCKEEFAPQTSLEMWLEMPETKSSFYTRGEVVWSHQIPESEEYRTGIRLEKAELLGLAPILWK